MLNILITLFNDIESYIMSQHDFEHVNEILDRLSTLKAVIRQYTLMRLVRLILGVAFIIGLPILAYQFDAIAMITSLIVIIGFIWSDYRSMLSETESELTYFMIDFVSILILAKRDRENIFSILEEFNKCVKTKFESDIIISIMNNIDSIK